MGVAKTLASIALSPVAALVGAFTKPKPPKIPLQAPPQARRSSLINDELAGRTGTRANRRSSGRQETSGGLKTTLGS